MRHIQNTKHYSIRIGRISKGCRQCIKGEKLVLFVTGLCPRKCWYCPLSDKKMFKDVTYANEWPTNSIKTIIKEAELTEAKGAGITGGDPLCTLKRTESYIHSLKKRFGKKFHIHLYTSLELATIENLQRLNKSGLDEIRFHPDIEKINHWNKIKNASLFDWDIGVEIPVIPKKEKQTKELIDYFSGFIDFLNLNELETTETNNPDFMKKGLRTKDQISQAIVGSEKVGTKLLEYCINKPFNVHFCTAKLKDKAQLKNRIKRRAKNVCTEYDEITNEGLLIRPVVYGNMRRLKKFADENNLFYIPDNKNKRIIIEPYCLKDNIELIKREGFKPAIVEEYPTWDSTKIMVEYL
ncbi:MAG: radical SAM protein [Nanoarchaeota archaeon]